MGKTDISRVVVNPGDSLPRGDTDRDAVVAMSDEEVL